MNTVRAILLSGTIASTLWTANLMGQEVEVTSDKNGVTLSVTAQNHHVSGQQKAPVLGVVCQQKGKKITHAITYSPGGMLTEQEYSNFGNSTALALAMTIGDHKESTNWVSHNFRSFQSFEYVGKTEPERIQFLQTLLSVPSVSIAFTPFLTGTPTSSTFDLTGLRTEFEKHPECSLK